MDEGGGENWQKGCEDLSVEVGSNWKGVQNAGGKEKVRP